MGEKINSVFIIGSADLDIMLSKKLKSIEKVKKHYDVKFENYAILLWHPVTSEISALKKNTLKLINFVNNSSYKFIVIYSNNDPGTEIILETYKKKLNRKKNKLFQSLRFENFLTILKNAKFILGNSSSGIYEAPVFGTPTINIGNRQFKRSKVNSIKNININELTNELVEKYLKGYKKPKKMVYGNGKAAEKFLKIINKKSFWRISPQKFFHEV